MKKIVLFLVTLMLLAVNTSCDDWLTLKPEGEVVLEDFWQNETQVNSVLATCYRAMTERSMMNRMMIWGELRSDNVVAGDLNDDMDANIKGEDMTRMLKMDITVGNQCNRWGSIYSVINYCNIFLHYAPGVVALDENFTENELHSMEAEVLAIRALCYFYLVRTFKEVPWIDSPSIDDTQDYRIPKSTEEVVLANIVTDLKTSLKYARERFDIREYNKGRVTKSMINALLADIALWQEDYPACITYCDAVMSQDYELVEGEDVLTDVFYTGNSTESIFELQFDDDGMFNDAVKNFYGSSGDITGGWKFSPELVSTEDVPKNASPFRYSVADGFESEYDIRLKDFLFQYSDEDFYVFKYAGRYRDELEDGFGSSVYWYSSFTANWIVYRLSDVILMKAEALVQQNRLAEALELVNMTYLRSNINTISDQPVDSLQIATYNSKSEMTKLVLRERQRELMFEGKRWFDLMRLARRDDDPASLLNYVVKKGSTIQSERLSVMDALYLPIHDSEMEANKELVQNPFYQIDNENITK